MNTRRHFTKQSVVALILLSSCFIFNALADDKPVKPVSEKLAAAVSNPHRSEAFIARDSARHPIDVLEFAQLEPSEYAIEIWPSGGYWAEILTPLIEPNHYRIILSPKSPEADAKQVTQWQNRFAQWGRPNAIEIGWLGHGRFELGQDNSADIVMTFRNIHNWMEDDRLDATLEAIYRVLKPGGRLLIEEHRGRTDRPQDPKGTDGYVREDFMLSAANHAGFKLKARSEVLANPRDTKDYPQGVWTLPPTLALGDKDREKYISIGEADNFLLLFVKPKTHH